MNKKKKNEYKPPPYQEKKMKRSPSNASPKQTKLQSKINLTSLQLT